MCPCVDARGWLPNTPSTLEDSARWVTRMGCRGRNIESNFNDGTFSNLVWDDCREGTEFELMTVRGGVHAWWTLEQGGFQTTTYMFSFFNRVYEKRQAWKAQQQQRDDQAQQE